MKIETPNKLFNQINEIGTYDLIFFLERKGWKISEEYNDFRIYIKDRYKITLPMNRYSFNYIEYMVRLLNIIILDEQKYMEEIIQEIIDNIHK